MRLSLVLLGMVLALAACSSHPVARPTAEAPIVPLVAEEEASVTASSKPPGAQKARESAEKKPAATKHD